jgi:hypothetical protein
MRVLGVPPDCSLARAGYIDEDSVKLGVSGKVLAGVTGNRGICNPQTLQVAGEDCETGGGAVIGHQDSPVFHLLSKEGGLASRRGAQVEDKMVRLRRQGEGRERRGEGLRVEETERVVEKTSWPRQTLHSKDQTCGFSGRKREPAAFKPGPDRRR